MSAEDDGRSDSGEPALVPEKLLRDATQRLNAIYHASSEGLTLCRAVRGRDGSVVDYRILECNDALTALTGVDRETLLGATVRTQHPTASPQWFTSATRVLATGELQHFDVRSGVTGRWLNVRVSYVGPELFQQTIIDVTDRHLLDTQRQQFLAEMNHRTMNNFQMIASFLHLQGAQASEAVRVQLQAAQNRIEVLAGLHAMLTEADEGTDIDMGAYVAKLCRQLHAIVDRPDAVRIDCHSEPLKLDAAKAVPLGFVVNELVTNAVKYAFPPPAGGTIRVRLEPVGDRWRLTVTDDGVGLAPKPKPAPPPTQGKSRGLGTKLVDSFVRQLGSELVTLVDGGVRHTILFRP